MICLDERSFAAKLAPVLWLTLGLSACSVKAADSAAQIEFFENRIRPVLAEHCYSCHSEKSEKLKADLFLDTREGTLKGGESGQPSVVPGDPDKSLLIQAIRYDDDHLQMPPKRKLSDAQIQDFVTWVRAGAADPRGAEAKLAKAPVIDASRHWAFQPVSAPAIPDVKEKSWPRSPLDHFILARLEEKGLKPSPAADKKTWIRRVTVDLTGLPPSMQEVDAFLNDASPSAESAVVDRLLSSPRYGERWGRSWLDTARYADTKGYVYSDREEGRFVHSHVYRDWVIRALNEDMPYDRFLKLQIAADQLAKDTNDLAAAGFITLGRRFLGVSHDIIDDRIDVVMRGAQAMTVGCARCHDHKFDPIPTRDYYSLYGVFAGGSEKMVALAESDNKEYLDGMRERVKKFDDTLAAKREHFSNQFRDKVKEYLVAALDAKKLPTEEFYEIRGPNDLNPTIVRAWEAYLSQTAQAPHPVFGYWHKLAELPSHRLAAEAPAVLLSLESQSLNPQVARYFSTNPPAAMKEVAEGYGALLSNVHGRWQEALKLAETNQTSAPLALPDAGAEQLRQILYGSNTPTVVPMMAAVDMEWYFDEPARVELMKLHSEVERWIIKSAGAPPHALVLEDRPVQKDPRVFIRGNPASKGEETPRQFLEAVAGKSRQPFQKGSGRLELAKAVASRDNPLTARVMVNRVWLGHFGAGLVRTPSDFGTRSEPPSHPELLDWLAMNFMEEGWSLKKLHRQIVLSQTYRQSSGEPEEAVPDPNLIDPENRLLWRMNRQRMDFETLRDSLLFASGELDLRLGGKPEELFGKAPTMRRAVYGLIDRQFLPAVLRSFDFANPDMHSPQRAQTTAPQQALFFMNSPFVADRCRAVLTRPEASSAASPEEKIRALHRAIYQREPSPRQLERGLAFVRETEAEPGFAPPPPPVSAWIYGYGEFREHDGKIAGFTPLPHFTGEAWQGGENWPDSKLGWARLTAEGGHSGNDLQHAVVRRWIAPEDMTVSIQGSVKHSHKAGDGIHAGILSSRGGVLGSWKLQDKTVEAGVARVELKKGDTLDFFVNFNAGLNSDDFIWAPVIKQAPKEPAGASEQAREWSAKKEFSGPAPVPPKPLSAWEKYAQVLLLSNEFIFVD